MSKSNPEDRYLSDWDTQLTDDWIKLARTMQTSHCQNIGAHEKGVRYKKDLFYQIDDLILMHAFGASAKKGTQHSDTKNNFNSYQRKAAANVRKKIIKHGKITNVDTGETSVSVQVIAVTLLIVDSPKAKEEKKDDKSPPGLAQIAVFRVVKPDGNFCFVDQGARVYSDWNDYLSSNNLPRSKMCYPKNGVYLYQPSANPSTGTNNNEGVLDLALSESVSCTTWSRFKSGTLTVVSYGGLVAGVVSIVAAPFTGGTAPYAYAVLASTMSGWIGAGCMAIGLLANIGSLVDKYSHDESFYTEIGAIVMTLFTLGVSRYNSSILNKVRNGIPVTRLQLVMMTVLNCAKFGLDSIMFATTLAHLVMKICNEGFRSITAIELVQFSMSAYFFGKSVIAPKTGYGIIKEVQRRYLMVEKAAKITDEGVLGKYKEYVDGDKRFGPDTIGQKMKDDFKGFTCSKEVCDELNKNAKFIRNINTFHDLNQFFVEIDSRVLGEVKDTNSELRMTDAGNLMVNEELEIHTRRLNEIGKTDANGVNEHRKNLLKLTADYQQGTLDPNQNQQQNRQTYDAGLKTGNYKYGEDRLLFEIDRRAIQARFGGVTVNGRPVFNNMSLGVADRLWRVATPMGGNAGAIMDATKAIAENMNVTDPRQMADIMEFVNFKRSEITTGNPHRTQFLNDMKDPTTAVFQQTVTEWNDAIRAARQVLQTADMPWTSETSAAYHYFKHKDDFRHLDASQQPAGAAQQPAGAAQQPADAAQQPAAGAPEPFENLVRNMERYLNEQWQPAIRPENQTYQGHSQDGRTFKKSYRHDIPNVGSHLAFTVSDAENRAGETIASHFIPRN